MFNGWNVAQRGGSNPTWDYSGDLKENFDFDTFWADYHYMVLMVVLYLRNGRGRKSKLRSF